MLRKLERLGMYLEKGDWKIGIIFWDIADVGALLADRETPFAQWI